MNKSQYAPMSKSEYSAKDLNVDFKGAKFDLNIDSVNDCDYKVNDDFIFDGIILDVINQSLGDKVAFQVIDKDNVLGYGSNVVLKQFATDIFICPGIIRQINYDSGYPAKIFAGLYLRIKYTSVSTLSVPTIIVRYNLHKILW